MPAYTPVRLAQAQPGITYGTIYTVPAAKSILIKEILVCNTTGAAVTFDMSFVASGGTAGVTNNVVSQHQIGAYQTVSYVYSQVLATGGFIACKAGTAAALTVTASGAEFV